MISIFDFHMRPGPSTYARPDCSLPATFCPRGTNPGRTYRFYTGTCRSPSPQLLRSAPSAAELRSPVHAWCRACSHPSLRTHRDGPWQTPCPCRYVKPFWHTSRRTLFSVPHGTARPAVGLCPGTAVVPFGFGLSYSTFKYEILHAPAELSLAPLVNLLRDTYAGDVTAAHAAP